MPEVIYAPRKTDAALAGIVRRFVEEKGMALATRVTPDRAAGLREALSGLDAQFSYDEDAGILEVTAPDYRPPAGQGRIGILTAGTSDIPVAEEAALVARHMGCSSSAPTMWGCPASTGCWSLWRL